MACFTYKGLILLVIASTVIGSYQNDKKKSRPITYRQYCRDGDSIDKLFPDPFPFTCKPGPGKNVVCQTLYIEYTYRDCDVQVDDATSNGRSYRVNKGKVIVGFNSEDGGVTWNNIECSYKSPSYSWEKQDDSAYCNRN